MKKPELLSPVGNIECLKAAIEAGCDAVYLGGYTFGARNYAGNFSNEEIIEAINYSHLYGVKVYVTVNTLVYENEVNMFLEYVDFLHSNNVDALIIQDLGMMDLIRKVYPNLELHASTQMHIHNLEGVKFANNMGLKRVVLARETSYELLKEIRANTDIELEIFVHGALCVSYSGQCLMSSMIGGRSGNRGTCTGCCRLEYDLISDNKKVNRERYLLSTKDLKTIENIPSLIDLGIDSLKIEGRMKRPEYVYLITSLYRKAIDNYIKCGKTLINDKDIQEMEKIFNREFTTGFLFNEENNNFTNAFRPNHLGIIIGKVAEIKNGFIKIKLTDKVNQGDGIRIINSNEDCGCTLNKIYLNERLVNSADSETIEINFDKKVNIGDVVVKTTDIKQLDAINNKLKNKIRKVKINGVFHCLLNKPISLILNDGVNEVKVKGELVTESAKIHMDNTDFIKQISKMGNTVYELDHLEIIRDENIFVKISALNELRREACELLDKKRVYKTEYKKDIYNIETIEYNEQPGMSILINGLEAYNKIKRENYKYIYTETELEVNDNRVIRKLPRVMDKVIEKENTLNGELGSLYLNKGCSDFSLNVVNSYTLAFLNTIGSKRITLSYELTLDQINEMVSNYKIRYQQNPNLEVIIDSYPEVMVTKFDILKKYDVESGYLNDIKNRKFELRRKNNITYIYNYKRVILDRNLYFAAGINTLRIQK